MYDYCIVCCIVYTPVTILAVLVVHINAQSTTFTFVHSDLEEVWLRLGTTLFCLAPYLVA